MRKLAAVASTRSCVVTATQRKRMLWGEGVACIGLPVLTLPIFYVLQGHRYNILESDGCEMALYPSWPGYVMRFFLPIMVALGALIYASESFASRHLAVANWVDDMFRPRNQVVPNAKDAISLHSRPERFESQYQPIRSTHRASLHRCLRPPVHRHLHFGDFARPRPTAAVH